jgi:hypothetical protein
MTWYSIKFTPAQIQSGQDKNFIVDFRMLYERSNKLEGMALYKDNHYDQHYRYYYIKLPGTFPFDPIKLFAHKGIVKTFPQAILKLEPIEGDTFS